MIASTLFNADHEAFRDSFRRICDREIAPRPASAFLPPLSRLTVPLVSLY